MSFLHQNSVCHVKVLIADPAMEAERVRLPFNPAPTRKRSWFRRLLACMDLTNTKIPQLYIPYVKEAKGDSSGRGW